MKRSTKIILALLVLIVLAGAITTSRIIKQKQEAERLAQSSTVLWQEQAQADAFWEQYQQHQSCRQNEDCIRVFNKCTAFAGLMYYVANKSFEQQLNDKVAHCTNFTQRPQDAACPAAECVNYQCTLPAVCTYTF